jgi:hypothetical protein
MVVLPFPPLLETALLSARGITPIRLDTRGEVRGIPIRLVREVIQVIVRNIVSLDTINTNANPSITRMIVRVM